MACSLLQVRFCAPPIVSSNGNVHRLPQPPFVLNFKSSSFISSTPLFLRTYFSPSPLAPPLPAPSRSLRVFAVKHYKMKTHKASAKRFRVTGRGIIMRRRAGKQHLLKKKSRSRKRRLSKMVRVSRSDYDNVIGCLPYLKVDRRAV